MRFKQFQKQLYEQSFGASVEACQYVYNHKIVQTDRGVYVDGECTHFGCIDEAKQHIKQQNSVAAINEEIDQDSFKTLPINLLTDIIHKHNSDSKVTDTLIESYINVAASKQFTTDKVVYDMRVINRTNRLLEGYLDYILDDNTVIAISEQEQKSINTLLEHRDDLVVFMKQNKDNFLQVLEQVKGTV